MSTTVLLCTLAVLIGLPLGYYTAWALDQAQTWMEQYLDGCSEVFWLPEVWR